MGLDRHVKCWKRYSVNGYNFRTFNKKKDVEKCTINNGVCVSSLEGADYYGTLDEVIELKYVGSRRVYKTILFKCDWMDNSHHGVDVHKDYKLVEVNRGRKYQVYDPFVLAHQVEQVYYAPYPNMKRDRDQWSVVFKTKARSTIEAPVDETFFQEQVVTNVPHLTSLHNDEREYDDNEVIDDDELVMLGEEGDEEEPLPEPKTQQNSDDEEEIFDLQVDENVQIDDEEELFPLTENDYVDVDDDDDDDDSD